jgi:hypothetical protein
MVARNSGNGLTDYMTMYPAYFDLQCTPASVYPIQDITSVVSHFLFFNVLTRFQYLHSNEGSGESHIQIAFPTKS